MLPHSSHSARQYRITEASPGLIRRLAAFCYDVILLTAVLFFATLLVLPLNQGQAFEAGQFFYRLYLSVVIFFFFTGFWTHGGQTLGLKSWKMIVLTQDGLPLNWRQATLRFIGMLLSSACLGLGYLWILVDPKNYSWHDRLSGTAIFLIEKQSV